MITQHDNLVRKLAPLASKLITPASVDREKRVDAAIGGGGEILDGAIFALDFYATDLRVDNRQVSNGSTTNWVDGGELTANLGDGIWIVKFKASARMTNTAGVPNHFRTMLDGIPTTFINRAATISGSVPFFDGQVQKIVGGREVLMSAQFRTSNVSGSAEMNDLVTEYEAIRIG